LAKSLAQAEVGLTWTATGTQASWSNGMTHEASSSEQTGGT
jgi:hypothetical protein